MELTDSMNRDVKTKGITRTAVSESRRADNSQICEDDSRTYEKLSLENLAGNAVYDKLDRGRQSKEDENVNQHKQRWMNTMLCIVVIVAISVIVVTSIIAAVVVVVLNKENGLATSTQCPNDWLAYIGSWYLFGSSRVIFSAAKEFCSLHGSYLVHVESQEENTFLKGYMKYSLKDEIYWLGMTDEITEGIWKWYGDKSAVQFFDWGPREPGGKTHENCAAFLPVYDYQWVDTPCASTMKSICEKRVEGT